MKRIQHYAEVALPPGRLGLLAMLVCLGLSSCAQTRDPAKQTEKQVSPESAIEVAAPQHEGDRAGSTGNSSVLLEVTCLEQPAQIGYEGEALELAARAFVALHGTAPDLLSDLTPFSVFQATFANFEIFKGKTLDGRAFIGAARAQSQRHWNSREYFVETCESAVWAGATPKMGLIEAEERIVIWHDDPQLDQVATANLLAREALSSFYTGDAELAASTDVATLQQRYPPELRQLALFHTLVKKALMAAAFYNSHDSGFVTSWNEVTDWFGEPNPAAWINPYTQQPMVEVEGSPGPGDYTIVETPEGVRFGLGYRDVDGSAKVAWIGPTVE